MRLELIATTTFGLEAVVKREIQNLGYKIISAEDGKITYLGDEYAIARSNLWLRSAERVLVKMGEFKALSFEELFQQTKALHWEEWIPIDGEFPVNGSSVKSKLSSVPACQSIVKKAIVERMGEFYCQETFAESGVKYPIKATLLKDRVTLTLDTTGVGLHKRGYRVNDVTAPIKETLASAMVMLSFWNKDRVLIDPCCGSGTIVIEAAMIGRNIAPGLNREFISQKWDCINPKVWKEERKKAFKEINHDCELNITGIDIESYAIKAAKENAMEAGVDEDIRFINMDMKKLKITNEDNGIIITNPPYGERIGDTNIMNKIYNKLNELTKENPRWSLFMITTDKDIERKVFNKEANRRRKLYNGRLEACYYQFHGERKKDEN
ncbi:MAG TPA: class I SAM-dependent RNA methyltransferase [Anaerovoracaceae bacterium]|nr:class I SAM-dependent RNA methyltransferase [Anaerovoracaceae bacterium]